MSRHNDNGATNQMRLDESSIERIDPKTHRLFEVELYREFFPEELQLINTLENTFRRPAIFFSTKDKKLTFAINSIDTKKLELEITALIDKLSLNEKYLAAEDNPFLKILKNISDVKSYGIKAGKKVYVGYNKEQKVQNRKAKEKQREIYYYAKNNNFDKNNVSIPDTFKNKILCGDSEAILKKLPNNCIDLVFTSPPYNFGLDYANTKDESYWETYFDKLFSIFRECIRVVKYGGRIIVNVQPLFSDYIPSHHIISNFFIKEKMIWRGEILWDKHNYNCKYTAWGSWKSPSNPYLKYTWEFLEIFCKGGLKLEGQSSNADVIGDEFKKWVYAKWDIAPERKMKELGHPAMFPEKLTEQVLKLFSFKNSVILDPFNGAGTTTLVSKRTGRTFLGIDISEKYCNIAEGRLKATL